MKGSILLVDDDYDIRVILVMVLEREGYTVFPFSDMSESIQSIKEGLKYDLALVDLTMPDRRAPTEDVDDLIRESRSRHPGVPIVTFSAWPDTFPEGNKPGYKRKGVTAHYHKGCADNELENLLETIQLHIKR